MSKDCIHEERTWEKESIAVVGNRLRCNSTCLSCGKKGYDYYKLDEFKVNEK